MRRTLRVGLTRTYEGYPKAFLLMEAMSDQSLGSNVGPGLLSTAEGAVLVISANLPLMRPLCSHLPFKRRPYHTREDEYKKINGSFVMKTLSSNSGPSTLTTSRLKLNLISQNRHHARPAAI